MLTFALTVLTAVLALGANQDYMTTNWYLNADCTGDIIMVDAHPANVCVNQLIMRTSGEAVGNGYKYDYEVYSDTKCTKFTQKSTYIMSGDCIASEYGRYSRSFYSPTQPFYPEKGLLTK